MDKTESARRSLNLASSEDVRRIFRHLDDHTVASVLALKPTVAQLEEAATRMGGAADIFADIRPAKGVVEAIMDLLETVEADSGER